MSQTRPTSEQLRFRSQYTGDHVLDTYMEAAEKGGRSLSDLLDDLFDANGAFDGDLFQFRYDTTSGALQFRVGVYADSSTGWNDLTTFFRARGTFASSTEYDNFDLITLSTGDVYYAHGLSAAQTFADEAAVIASSNTSLLVNISLARDWATKTDGAVASGEYSAKYHAQAASASASAASASETAAGSSETAAAASQTAAASSASAASTSATAAASSESAAATSETNAASSASAAAASETAAAASETAASASETAAAASETAAAASEAAAATSETNAASSASAASTSASNASTSATAASTSASNAATSASAASTSASAASTSASNASTSASAASTAQTAAEAAQTAAEAAQASTEAVLDSFDDRYLGSKASAPTVDNDGDPLAEGMLYWNSTTNILNIYNGSSWVPFGSGTMSAQDADNVAITGGSIDGVAIGGSTPAAGAFTTLSASVVDASARVDSLEYRVTPSSGSFWTITGETTANRLSFETAGVERFWINTAGGGFFSGYFGIGTTSPAARVHAVVDNSDTVAKFERTGSNPGEANISFGGNYAYFDLKGNATDRVRFVATSTRALQIETGSATRLTLLDNGNLGIGTTSPGFALDVNGEIASDALLVGTDTSQALGVTIDTSSAGEGVALFVQSLGGSGSAGIVIGTHASSVSSDLAFSGNAVIGAESSVSNTVKTGGYFRWLTGATSNTTGTAGGTEKMRLNATGLGIGTTSPSRPLHVAGTSRLGNADNASAVELYGAALRGVLWTTSAGVGLFDSTFNGRVTVQSSEVLLWADGAERARVDATGLGIGTTNPVYPLHVRKNQASATYAVVENQDAAGSALFQATADTHYVQSLVSASGSASVVSNATQMIVGTTASGPLYLRTAGSNRVTVGASGNVGIGTTSPAYPLQVVGAYALSGVFQNTAGSSSVVSEGLSGYGAFYAKGSGTNAAYLFFGNAASGERARISADDGGSITLRASGPIIAFQNNEGTEIARMNSNGVGIGTTSSGEILHTLKTSAGAETFIVHQNNSSTASTGAGLRLAPSSFASGATIRAAEIVGVLPAGGTAVGLHFRTSNGGNPATRMAISAAGKVGINTTDPEALLHILGTNSAGGIFVQDSVASSAGPAVRVQGQRSDSNVSDSFAGKIVLEHLRTDGAANSGKALGAIIFGGNHTDGTAGNIAYSASIVAQASGNFNSASDMPTDLVFYTGVAGRSSTDTPNVDFGTEAMRLTSAGYLGIGTTNPLVPLHVVGRAAFGSKYPSTGTVGAAFTATSSYAPGIQVRNYDAAGWARFDVQHDSASQPFMIIQDAAGSIFFRNDSGASTLMQWMNGGTALATLLSSGNLGIGTTMPSNHFLHVLRAGGTTTGVAKFESTLTNAAADVEIIDQDNSATRSALEIKGNAGATSIALFRSNGRINMPNLPTSSTGLVTGDLWNDAGTLKVA